MLYRCSKSAKCLRALSAFALTTILIAGSSGLMAQGVEEAVSGSEAESPALVDAAALAELQAKYDSFAEDVDTLWICLAAFLVFFMQAGFSYVEAGFIRTKNVVNILMKNLIDFSAGSLMFWLAGFAIMFGPLVIDGVGLGSPGPATDMLNDADGKPVGKSYAFFMFQLVFCATAATIVSGAIAERTKFHTYIIGTVLISAVVYPVFGSFAWSNLFDDGQEGFLVKLGFIDFAGSTVVHSVGGWLGLAGAILVGPRYGKYTADGAIMPIFGHNMSMATLGAFMLWLGWFGFNPGSTTAIGGGDFAIIAVTTNIAAAAGGLTAMITSWLMFRRPDISMMINGVLSGLVAITAGCYNVDIFGSAMIGIISGVICVFSVILFDKLRVDDPVGAISVHGVNGAWGTLAVGLFAHPDFGDGVRGLFYGGGIEQLYIQGIGVLAGFVWAFGCGLIIFGILKLTIGLRVDEEEELEGLDLVEHGNEAYPELV
ncbi:MAG: ammonium transporter [bacterium]|nr:ammonium transporter [bacterium]